MKILLWHQEFVFVSLVVPHRVLVKCTSNINLMEVNNRESKWNVADKEFLHEIKHLMNPNAYYIYAGQTMERLSKRETSNYKQHNLITIWPIQAPSLSKLRILQKYLFALYAYCKGIVLTCHKVLQFKSIHMTSELIYMLSNSWSTYTIKVITVVRVKLPVKCLYLINMNLLVW